MVLGGLWDSENVILKQNLGIDKYEQMFYYSA